MDVKLFVAGIAIVYQIMVARVMIARMRHSHEHICAPNSPDMGIRRVAFTTVMALLSLGFAATVLVLVWFITGQ